MQFAGYQQITSVTTGTVLTIPTGARGALIQAEAQNVRWRADGTASTAAVGMILYSGDPPTDFSECIQQPTQGLAKMQFIQTTAGAILNVHYYY